MKFTYQKIQYGYWGKTPLKNAKGDLIQRVLHADRWSEADVLIRQLTGPDKKLANGDYRGWERIEESI